MIIGRQEEQAELASLLSAVRAGSGRLLVIVGDAGFGKTTLLEWARFQADGITVLRAAGRPSEADLPFQALADLLRPLTGEIGDLPGPQSRALGSALALVEGSGVDQTAVNAATLTLLDRQEPPLLLLVDDHHWLDTASRDVVDFAARRAGDLGLGMVIASREPTSEHRSNEMRLNPLSPQAASELVSNRGSASPEAMNRVLTLGAGNPLALLELPLDADALASEPFAGRHVSISAALDEAYRYRLNQLPEPTRSALLCAALEDTGVAGVLLETLAALGIDGAGLDPAERAGLIVLEAHRFRFRHPLLRAVIIQAAGPDEVARVNLALAEATEDDDQRAWYLAAATTRPDDRVADALDAAAARALSRGAAGAAAAALERAAALTETSSGRSSRLAAAARAAHKAGDMDLTARLIELARSTGSADDPTMHLLEADIRMRRGDVAGAYGALRLEADGIAARDPRQAATMLLVASKLRVYRLEGAAVLREVDDALALIPSGEHNLLHLGALAMARVMAGHPEARETAREAMRTAMSTPHGHTYTLSIGWTMVWLEEYEQPRAFISRSMSIQREGGHLAYLPQALLPMAELEFRTGSWDRARESAAEALALCEESQQPIEAAVAAAMLARIEACTGDGDGARQHADAAIAGDLSSGLRSATAFAEQALGVLELGQAHYLQAASHLERALSIVRNGEIGETWLLPVEADLAESYARLGRRSEARQMADDLVERGRSAGRLSAVGVGLRSLGLIADDGSFGALFEEALQIQEAMPTPFEAARTELCFGERLRRARHRVESRVRLRRALAAFESLGAAPWTEQARVELLASGETLQRSRPLVELTPQERQVAGLVATGATNREAAAELFVSQKTIEFHLGNVYRKLGVRSRTELANAMARSDS